jgi:tRNA threonylcarbamoyladenosine biosynthesis protein TsaB
MVILSQVWRAKCAKQPKDLLMSESLLLLAIDTCGPLGTVTLARLEGLDELTILGQTELPGKTYSAQLTPAIRDLLSNDSTRLDEIETIVVTNGPGSFTGIRIGLSTAKGLAEPTSIPILAVSRLVVLAHKAKTIAAALDASRHELYFGDYSSCSAQETLIDSDRLQQLANVLAGQLAVAEESLLTHAPQATLVPPPTAADALRFALPRLRIRDYDDPTTLDGNYLRRSDAEIFSKPKLTPISPA